jgi:hypothetical protein
MRHIKEVLIAVITAVLIAPGSIYIGYKLNDYLSKDNISIERVDLTADTTKLPYPSKSIMELYQNSRFQDYLLSRGAATIGLFTPGFYNYSARKFLQNEQIAEIITVLENFSKFNEELQARENTVMQRLENYKPGDSIADIGLALRNVRLSIVPLYTNNDAERVKVILDSLKNEKSNTQSAEQYKDNILNLL